MTGFVITGDPEKRSAPVYVYAEMLTFKKFMHPDFFDEDIQFYFLRFINALLCRIYTKKRKKYKKVIEILTTKKKNDLTVF